MGFFPTLALLNLVASTYTQTIDFVDFLAPQDNEKIRADSSYMIKWDPKLQFGKGRMSLLSGESPESLSIYSVISDILPVADGIFCWEIMLSEELPLADNPLYNAQSYDTSDNTSNEISDRATPDGDDDNDRDGDDGPPHKPPTRTTTFDSKTSLATFSGNSSTPTGIITSIPPGTQSLGSIQPASTDDRSSSQAASSQARRPSVGTGMITGIAIGATAVVLTFAGLIGLVLYYRHRLLGKSNHAASDTQDDLKIDGKFRKAELDAKEPEIKVTRVHELNTTCGIREADGIMKPAELDFNNMRFELSDTDISYGGTLTRGLDKSSSIGSIGL
ncbi:hypothetical protein F5Y19DRAFT_473495 [Xylariaceae sp. FL1651]|nr:hypothetical protein F5Y19DRAFT_473495 [Xylariaceae sp. FL1651]